MAKVRFLGWQWLFVFAIQDMPLSLKENLFMQILFFIAEKKFCHRDEKVFPPRWKMIVIAVTKANGGIGCRFWQYNGQILPLPALNIGFYHQTWRYCDNELVNFPHSIGFFQDVWLWIVAIFLFDAGIAIFSFYSEWISSSFPTFTPKLLILPLNMNSSLRECMWHRESAW